MLSIAKYFIINKVTIKNRIIRSATLENSATQDGKITHNLLKLYNKIAMGGSGLIITGAAAVNEDGKIYQGQLGIWNDMHIDGLNKLLVNVEKKNCLIAVQLFHKGYSRFGISLDKIEEKEILKIIEDFKVGAKRLEMAGYRAIAIHGAHGFLLSEFLSPVTNTRKDIWGGSLENRIRLSLEVCTGIRSVIDNDISLMWKLNAADFVEGGMVDTDYAKVAKCLTENGVDLIEVSGGITNPIHLKAMLKKKAGNNEAYFGESVYKFRNAIADKALAITGGIRSLEVMEDLINKGADFIGLCRPIITEPALPHRLMNTSDKRPSRCTSCDKCLIYLTESPYVNCIEFDELLQELN